MKSPQSGEKPSEVKSSQDFARKMDKACVEFEKRLQLWVAENPDFFKELKVPSPSR